MLNITGFSSKCSASNSGVVTAGFSPSKSSARFRPLPPCIIARALNRNSLSVLSISGSSWNSCPLELALDDKGDVSAETTGPAPAEVSAGIQISAERLLCYWLIPKSE
ncbi:hypothetical protein V6N11_042955 [Hibiscus sabdariffa]|uniref:Uncharacterized protein n=1 Tax=Hibiscus sabdariffa TaxID=183260 RepID=A0ABR2QYJ7_9ROSI